MLKNVIFKRILEHRFCLPHFTRMPPGDEILQDMKTFVKVSPQKNRNYLNFFSFVLFTRAHVSSGLEHHFRVY
jgi:hypothetical protein